MSLEELINKLNAFNCDALRNKNVSHCFVSNLGSYYIEDIEDIFFDLKNDTITIQTKNERAVHFDKERILTYTPNKE